MPTPKPKMTASSGIAQVLTKAKAVKPGTRRTTPLWKGPEVDGVTFSMLSRFIQCRERFRIHVIEGLRPAPTFKAPIEYGQMWHTCEEALAGNIDWQKPLLDYTKKLNLEYPMAREDINHWYKYCSIQFPRYVDYWAKHPDVKDRQPLFQEEVFNVPYQVAGRTVHLRGKFDSVDLIGKGRSQAIYIQENKTKSQISDYKISRQLTFDLQTMIYMIALKQWLESDPNYNGDKRPVAGVRYNVIRRSTHKTPESMLEKLELDTRCGRVGEWFSRWKIEINEDDLDNFRLRCFNPILTQLLDWYDWVVKDDKINTDPFGVGNLTHWQHPFGVRNMLDEGGSTDLDEYLTTGSEVGLNRTDKLFVELQ